MLTLESSFFPDRSPKRQLVSLTPTEAHLFQQVLVAHPFGIHVEHAAFLESLTNAEGNLFCSVRVTSAGRRQRQKIEICADTFVGMQRVFNSNIISHGYIDV